MLRTSRPLSKVSPYLPLPSPSSSRSREKTPDVDHWNAFAWAENNREYYKGSSPWNLVYQMAMAFELCHYCVSKNSSRCSIIRRDLTSVNVFLGADEVVKVHPLGMIPAAHHTHVSRWAGTWGFRARVSCPVRTRKVVLVSMDEVTRDPADR